MLLQWLSMQGQRRASPETEAKVVGASKDRPKLKREHALQSLTPASLTPGLSGAASSNVSRQACGKPSACMAAGTSLLMHAQAL